MNTTTQPIEMKTKAYVYGVDILDGDDAWALFDASAKGDVATVSALLVKDRRLVNAQYWYQFPIQDSADSGRLPRGIPKALVSNSLPCSTSLADAPYLPGNCLPSLRSPSCTETLEGIEEFLDRLRCNNFSDKFHPIYTNL